MEGRRKRGREGGKDGGKEASDGGRDEESERVYSSIEFTVLTISGPVILCKIIFTHKV